MLKSVGLGSLEKWDIATTSKFLKLYRDNKCLWDFTDASYKDKIQRNAAVEIISRQMNLPGFDNRYVILKIRALRSTYIYERRKVRQRLKNGEKFQTHLGWYHLADSFLRKYVVEKNATAAEEEKLPPSMSFTDCEELQEPATPSACTSSIQQQEQSTAKDELMEFLTSNADNARKSNTNNTELELNFAIDEDNAPIPSDQESYIEQKPQIQILNSGAATLRKKTTTKLTQISKPSTNESNSSPSNAALSSPSATSVQVQVAGPKNLIVPYQGKSESSLLQQDENEDEFDTFAKSVATQLKKLPREDAYVLQTQFQFLLSQAKLKAMGIQGSFGGLDCSKIFNFN